MMLAGIAKMQKAGFVLLLLVLFAFTSACSDDAQPGTSDTGVADTGTSDTDSSGEDADQEADADLADTGLDVEDPDIEEQDVEDLDVEDPDIEEQDVEDLDVDDPDIEEQDVEDLDVDDPDVEEQDVEDLDVDDPDVEEQDVEDLDVDDPDIEEQDVEDLDVDDPDVEDEQDTDVEPGPPSGSLDRTFGTDGIASSGSAAPGMRPYSLAVLTDNSIILAGDARSAAGAEPSCLVQRVEQSGALAGGFGAQGSVLFRPEGANSCSLRAASTGATGHEALLTGFSSTGAQEFAIVGRATATQVEHKALGRGAHSLMSFHAVLPMADGRLIGAGRDFGSQWKFIGTLTRHDQHLDAEVSFGTNRFRDIAWTQPSSVFMARDIAQLDAEHGLLVGTVERETGNASGLLVAFNLFTGALKADFGNAGIVEFGGGASIDRFQSVVVSSQRIYTVGSRGFGAGEDILIAAFTPGGVLDTTYGTAGVVLGEWDGRDRPFDSVLDAQGRLLVAGAFEAGGIAQPLVLRVLASGAFDANFEWFGIQAPPFDANESEARAIAVDANGRVLVAGRTRDAATGLDVPFLVRLIP